jgi:hypothetical protein
MDCHYDERGMIHVESVCLEAKIACFSPPIAGFSTEIRPNEIIRHLCELANKDL